VDGGAEKAREKKGKLNGLRCKPGGFSIDLKTRFYLRGRQPDGLLGTENRGGG